MSQNQRTQMVEQQVRAWEVFDPAVLDAMQNIPREEFLPEKFRNLGNSDLELDIRPGFLLPCPSVQGKVIQALEIEENDAIYQIGLGSGYLASCLAYLGGHLTTAEADAAVIEQAQSVFQRLGIKNINTQNTPWNEALKITEKRYDAIATQFAFSQVPISVKKALKINGVAVIFVGTAPAISCKRIERIGENEWLSEDLFETEVSPFPQKSEPAFSF